MHSSRSILVAWFLGITLAGGVGAQEPATGVLRGTVVEALGQRPIPGAVLVAQPGGWSGTTDASGAFRITGIPDGLYSLSVRQVGFQPSVQQDVRVSQGKATVVRVELSALPVTLAPVTVTLDPFPRDPEQGAGRFTYTAGEIRRTPGAAGDIFRAIETLPGVSSSGGGFSAFSVRGGGPHDNLILIDGFPFGKVTHLEGGPEGDEAQGGRFGIFAPDLVESADFRAGGFPAQYGGKNASLLMLNLREGNPESRTFSGRYDLLGWETGYDGPSGVGRSTSLLVSARHEDFARALKLIGRGDAGHPSFTDVIVKSTTDLGPRNRITVLGIAAPEQVVRTVDNILQESDTSDTWLYDWRENKSLIGASWRLLAGGASIIQTYVYLRHYTRRNGEGSAYPDLPIAGGRSIASRADVLVTDEAETAGGVRSVGTFNFARSAVIVSVEAERRRVSGGRSVAGADTLYTFDRYDQRPAPDQYYLVVQPATYDARVSVLETTAAASASYQRAVGADGSLTLGARLEHDGLVGPRGRDDVLPRANLTLPTFAGLSVTLAGGVYLQHPDVRDLVASPLNASLPPQRATHLIAGVSTLLRPDLLATVETYYRTLSDLPVLEDRARGIELPLGTGHASGLDATLVQRLTDRFFGQVSYSYAVSRRNDHRGAPAYDGDGNRPQALTLLGGFVLSARWSVSGKFKVASGTPTDTYVLHADIFPGSGLYRYSREITGHNAARLPALQTLNLRVDYQAGWGHAGIDAFLDVLNVYNHLNPTTVLFVERSGRIATEGIRIVPTFGLKFLF